MAQVCPVLVAGGLHSWRRRAHWNEGRRPVAQVGTILGAEMPLSWCRWAPFLAQVYHILGAGGVWGGGPAPQNGLLRTTVAQVLTLFPHLRQHTPTPAPTYPYTCAKIHRDLRQKAKIPIHLRHVVKKGFGERDEKGYHPPIGCECCHGSEYPPAKEGEEGEQELPDDVEVG